MCENAKRRSQKDKRDGNEIARRMRSEDEGEKGKERVWENMLTLFSSGKSNSNAFHLNFFLVSVFSI